MNNYENSAGRYMPMLVCGARWEGNKITHIHGACAKLTMHNPILTPAVGDQVYVCTECGRTRVWGNATMKPN